uniref:Uncharacterized protein n=1 Tax=Plectus sambesii TaxID=2011161 RepID=A0A914VCW9_9BILA
MGCGKQGYLIGYGKKYCDRFSANLHRFTSAGIKWVSCVRQCLIDSLTPHYDLYPYSESHSTCGALEQAAFETHVDCYINCGFCNICIDNKWALWKSYDIGDFVSLIAWEQVRQVAQKCGGWTKCF